MEILYTVVENLKLVHSLSKTVRQLFTKACMPYDPAILSDLYRIKWQEQECS